MEVPDVEIQVLCYFYQLAPLPYAGVPGLLQVVQGGDKQASLLGHRELAVFLGHFHFLALVSEGVDVVSHLLEGVE